MLGCRIAAQHARVALPPSAPRLTRASMHHHALRVSPCARAFSSEVTGDAPDGLVWMPTVRPVRNVAVIAHVDHGKTTLIDQLLMQTGRLMADKGVAGVAGSTAERVMDNTDLEKERGITILSKLTSFNWAGGDEHGDSGAAPEALAGHHDIKFNIVDTPGHADFAGEVQRVLSMVDGAMLLVDATEGPMAQTKYVLAKALARGLRPMVVLNKVDRDTARLGDVENEVFDLFAELDASDEQLDFPIVYASAKDGWASVDPPEWLGSGARPAGLSMVPLLRVLRDHVPPPRVLVSEGAAAGVAPEDAADASNAEPLRLLVTTMDRDPFVGRLVQGRVTSGTVAVGDSIVALSREGKRLEESRVVKLFARDGLDQVTLDSAVAGDIVQLAGLATARPSDTVVSPGVTQPLPADPIDPPTISMTFAVNDSPLAGREGKYLTSAQIAKRLEREAETNVSIVVTQAASEEGMPDAMEVRGRGELQLAILVESMRREGFELSVSPPRVVLRREDGSDQVLEPWEQVVIDVEEEYAGSIIDSMAQRKGQMQDFVQQGNRSRLTFLAPSRGLIGAEFAFKTETRGTALIYRSFARYDSYEPALNQSSRGALISSVRGVATAYTLANLEPRGVLFVSPQDEVYEGMIVGEHARGSDLEVNPTKEKKLTNMRASGTDEAIRLTPPTVRPLEEAITYVNADELVEVTPGKLRLRKRVLDGVLRKQMRRKSAKGDAIV